MKTEFYNPSKLEIDLAKAITALKPQLAAQLSTPSDSLELR